ncbi:Uu.00g126510.m01.CDS01 [Anthostomella pinea]|uniref:Uu.00g126510.m01.CDS01 n=1 Tax=Anthostomella pinea TaxID=933095 RepID=A0AAI8VCN9_9PEZI|nr:Uu.00g126510.m01.CDS01 [Anthostomella pinea]
MASSYLLCFSTITIWFILCAKHVSSQTCWRDTPCSDIITAAFPGEWEADIFAPASRTISPATIFDLSTGEEVGSWPTTFTLASNQSEVYLDFGKEVGSIVTLQYEVSSVNGAGAIGLAFTEAKNWVGWDSDFSNGDYSRPDGAIYGNFSSAGNYTYVMPDENLRGGFCYMTLFLVGDAASATITNVNLELSFQPTWSNLQAYQGYFHSNDDLLNQIWYSGAYTLQVDAIHPLTGRAWPLPDEAWLNTGELGPGDTINTDGAKRDRTVWPGDMAVAIPAAFYSTDGIE